MISKILHGVSLAALIFCGYVILHQARVILDQRTVMIEMYQYITHGCPDNPYVIKHSTT